MVAALSCIPRPEPLMSFSLDLSALDLSALGVLAVYVVLTAIVFVESALLVGFVLPGDTVLFAAGLLAGQ